ncbi:putative zinc-binding metallopeptidase [Acidovorax radicis]|uniref:zinc-binding metallopeptidase family protein n=1 Tax=Acidovorax radicis TaxID=758826 RepID=UPI001CFB86FA|nr:putative zinc-binding peptidase [Acidovorax radicis]UCV00197.1 putative zinc-binding peptidase [Acidovorax radicis]
MRALNCDHCGHLVFFDSVQCVHCGNTLAFLPDRLVMAALAPSPQDGPGVWRCMGGHGAAQHAGRLYRMCRNQIVYQACNFAVPVGDASDLCASCRQTRVLPDLSEPTNIGRWMQIEAAKRRLFYTLARLRLEPAPGGTGPVFEFLADVPGWPAVLTGHLNGTITLNVAEADDDVRASRRIALGEPFRTLVGHLRHESGHFYWDQLVRDGGRMDAFRQMFGDERQDYTTALDAHYARGNAQGNWAAHYVSAYAAAHPWEDWAETWAHYLHMIDLLETSASFGTEVTVPGIYGAQHSTAVDPFARPAPGFDAMVQHLVPLTLLLNSLTRSLGQLDAYPFALSGQALAKLRFVHDVVQDAVGGRS